MTRNLILSKLRLHSRFTRVLRSIELAQQG